VNVFGRLMTHLMDTHVVPNFAKRLEGLTRDERANVSPDEINGAIAKDFGVAFDRGKRISDFVGMVFRCTLSLFAALYFLAKMNSVPWIDAGWYAVCMVCAGAITLWLASQIFLIVLISGMSIFIKSAKAEKYVLSIVAIAIFMPTIMGLLFGLSEMVYTMAKANALLPKP
jgi:hypothetical protein